MVIGGAFMVGDWGLTVGCPGSMVVDGQGFTVEGQGSW